MKVIKRDGREDEFDKLKIYSAISKAMKYGSGMYDSRVAMDISNYIEDHAKKSHTLTIHEIEGMVYNLLIKTGYPETAKAYEGYRAVQQFKRQVNTTDDSILKLINNVNEEVAKENSNKNSVLASTQRDLIAGEISRDIARRKLIPAHIVQAHDEGAIHYHDMDYSIQHIHNCCLINLQDMLDNGTVINEKMVESPKSFATACTVTTQIMAQVASNQYGGQTITIAHLAPYLRKTWEKYVDIYSEELDDDYMIEKLATKQMMKELKDGVQTIRYQLSTLQTTNGQAPFATIYLEIQKGSKYEHEMALICEEMIKQRIDGMKNHRGQVIGEAFPKLVYLLDDHNCLEGGEYDYITKLAAKCNALRLVPDYQSAKIMRQNYEGNTFPPMGCRSHLSPWKDKEGNYKWYGRFNQGVVSLNLPQIGILAKGDMTMFWQILDQRLELCKEALLVRHQSLLGTKSDVSPIHWQYGAIARLKKGEVIDELLKNGYSTLSLGYVGMYELSVAMLGETHTTKKGEQFALAVMNHMNNACKKWKKQTGLGFSLYGTPAENLIYRFCKIDRAKFGILKGITDKEYYTNSYHVDVKEKIDAFTKLKFESQFHGISLGGCISYVEVPDVTKNLEAVEHIINYIYNNVQYAEINTKSDLCYKCGYSGELKNDENLEWYCPSCGNREESEMQVMRRTCGYIGTNYWNKGRTAEIKDRVTHL